MVRHELCIKRCACHINAHAPIEALQDLRDELGFQPEDIHAITIGGIENWLAITPITNPPI